MSTFYDKLHEGYYAGAGMQVTPIRKPQPPQLETTKPNKQQLIDYGAKYEKYEIDLAEWKQFKETENNELDKRNKQFKEDLFNAHIRPEDIAEYKSIIEVIYTWAYTYGHPSGYESIAGYFEDMLDILWEVKKL